MRQLWSDQVVFTRKYIIAAVAGRPVSEVLTKILGGAVAPIATAPAVRDLVPQFSPGDAAAVGLLSTMEAIGEAIVPYFGTEAGSDLTRLLRQHVLIAVELLAAARSGQLAKFKAEDERLIANADEIARLLSSLNQYWIRDILAKHLHLLLQLTKDEAVARIAGTFSVDLRTFDRIYAEAMSIAELLEDGLQKFPGQIVGSARRMETTEAPLYERLGGAFKIAEVVNHFSDRLIENPKVGQKSENPRLRAWHTEKLHRLPGLKFMRTLWVCALAGGPFEYVATMPGQTEFGLEEAHREFAIAPDEFDEVGAELSRSLDHFEVPKKEKDEVLAAFFAHKYEVTTGYRAATSVPA